MNQLLYQAYNGKFPKGTVNIVQFELKGEDNSPEEVSKATALKALSCGLSGNNLLNRLLGDQLTGKKPFPEAEGIVWNLQNKGNQVYSATVYEKWLTKNDFTKHDYECTVQPFEGPDDEE